MKRGTTPPLKFELPFDVSSLANLWITFSQNRNVVLNRELPECTAEGQSVMLTLSQAETLKLLSGTPVEIQLRVLTKDGQALASEIIEEPVGRILKDGEIT